jgi:hypothetical protein
MVRDVQFMLITDFMAAIDIFEKWKSKKNRIFGKTWREFGTKNVDSASCCRSGFINLLELPCHCISQCGPGQSIHPSTLSSTPRKIELLRVALSLFWGGSNSLEICIGVHTHRKCSIFDKKSTKATGRK